MGSGPVDLLVKDMKQKTLNQYLRERFGQKVYKLALDGGFTCPNRDGTLGTKGCIFCSAGGSGDFAEDRNLSITEQIENGKRRVVAKMPKNKVSNIDTNDSGSEDDVLVDANEMTDDVNSSESNGIEGDIASDISVSEDCEYTSKEEVALYIHLYNHLPSNFITKNEAKDLGWDSGAGNLNKVAPGKSIGGDKFGNREGLLPKKDKRVYYECYIDYVKGKRNGKRIVFSNDGLVYYTEDHYQTFELLYE